MSRTYRRRNPNRKNNTNFPAARYYSDQFIKNDEDLMYFDHWDSFDNNHAKNVKAAIAYYHSELYSNCYCHKSKTKHARLSLKSLRRNSNVILTNFIKSSDKENFDDIISSKPKDILWIVY